MNVNPTAPQMIPYTDEDRDRDALNRERDDKRHGFHPDRGWSKGEGATVGAAAPTVEPTTDFRELEPVPPCREWASAKTAELFASCTQVLETHTSDVAGIRAAADRAKGKDLANVKPRTPVERLQVRLRLARSAVHYHEFAVEYLQALQVDADANGEAAATALTAATEAGKRTIEQCGFLDQAVIAQTRGPKVLVSTLHLYLASVRAEAIKSSNAGHDRSSIRDDLKKHRVLHQSATDAVAWLEGKIREEVDAA